MPGKSNIQWCTDTWNPTTGCTRVSAGCDHCYAFSLHDQRHEAYKAGRFPDAPKQYHRPFSEVQLIPERLVLPLRWTKPRRIFVDSMADLFHADVPDSFIWQVWAVMSSAQQHTFQILTKRPQRMRRFLADPDWADKLEHVAEDVAGRMGWCHLNITDDLTWPLPNVWLGTSVENQEAAYRIDWLVKTPAVVHFLSCEPLLGPLNLSKWLGVRCTHQAHTNPKYDQVCPACGDSGMAFGGWLQWVIAGGESGPGFRSVDPDWMRDLRDQCVAASVPFFMKQWGGIRPKAGGRELDGREWSEFPQAMAS